MLWVIRLYVFRLLVWIRLHTWRSRIRHLVCMLGWRIHDLFCSCSSHRRVESVVRLDELLCWQWIHVVGWIGWLLLMSWAVHVWAERRVSWHVLVGRVEWMVVSWRSSCALSVIVVIHLALHRDRICVSSVCLELALHEGRVAIHRRSSNSSHILHASSSSYVRLALLCAIHLRIIISLIHGGANMVALLSLIRIWKGTWEQLWIEGRAQLGEVGEWIRIEHWGSVMGVEMCLLSGRWMHETVHGHIGDWFRIGAALLLRVILRSLLGPLKLIYIEVCALRAHAWIHFSKSRTSVAELRIRAARGRALLREEI